MKKSHKYVEKWHIWTSNKWIKNYKEQFNKNTFGNIPKDLGKAKLALREANNDKYCIKKKSKLLNESKKKMLLETGIGRHVGQTPKA